MDINSGFKGKFNAYNQAKLAGNGKYTGPEVVMGVTDGQI